MYSLLNNAVEDLSIIGRGTDLRVDNTAFFVSDPAVESYRSDATPLTVSLTESKASWAGFDAFEVRWTSLAA